MSSAKLFEVLQARPDHAAEPPGDGAAHAQPRGAAWHGAEPAGGRLLRPARVRRTSRHRGEPGIAAGPGLPGHARHLFEGAGRGLAQGHRPRARARRTHLHPDLACRPHLAHLAAGGWRQAGRAERDPRQGQDLRQRHLHRYLRAARARALREFPASSTTSSAARRMRSRPASTASRSTAPTAICWTSSPKTAPTSVPMLTAAESRIGQS